jgi:uncharacterized damage-inducible protein DinB
MKLVESLVQQIQEGYDKKAWHGTNLRGSIRGMTLDQLSWRPSSGRHSMWEIVVHCAYWKYAVWRRITGAQRGRFPLKGSNFFKRPIEKTEEAWKRDLRLLDEMHFQLVEAVSNLSESDLKKRTGKKKYTHLQVIQGIAMHDVYHAGQIQLLKRIM